MSRIGRKPIDVPAGVDIEVRPELVTVKGPKGELSERIHRDMTVSIEANTVLVTRPTDRGEHRALHGLTRSLVANMVEGVTTGYVKALEIQGVGYRANLKGSTLELALAAQNEFLAGLKACGFVDVETRTPSQLLAIYRQYPNIYDRRKEKVASG